MARRIYVDDNYLATVQAINDRLRRIDPVVSDPTFAVAREAFGAHVDALARVWDRIEHAAPESGRET